jgi:hypothetical protein
MSISKGVYDYYEALLDSGGEADPFREYSSLPMPASVFNGRTVADFVAQTSSVYNGGSGLEDLKSGSQSKILGAGRPFIYPQMADLYGNLRSHGYDVWIVSAGIGWAVRWMVANALNPAIVAKYGKDAALPLDRVVAVTTLMKDRSTGRLGLPTHAPDAGLGLHQSGPRPVVAAGDSGPAGRTDVLARRQDRCHRQHHQPRRTVHGGR